MHLKASGGGDGDGTAETRSFRSKRNGGRKLTFDVVVYDPNEKIAEGVNELLIVSAFKFLERVKRKL